MEAFLDVKIHYLGPLGTNAHEAAKQFANRLCIEECEFIPESTIHDVIRVVEHADGNPEILGCVPLENSIQGSVTFTWDRLLYQAKKAQNWYTEADFALSPSTSSMESKATFTYPQIVYALTLPIEHYLLTMPSTSLTEIETIYSHPQALGQCKHWMEKYLPHATQVAVTSTANAAMEVKDAGDIHKAAIGTAVAAQIYGLQKSENPIHDIKGNVTRFGLLSKVRLQPINLQMNHPTWTIAVCLEGVGNEPGGLLTALTPFHYFKLNLSRIESRPSGEYLGKYIFYLDITSEQSPFTDGMQRAWGTVKEMLHAQSIEVILLGTYPEILPSSTLGEH